MPLTQYRRKRDFKETSEPRGGKAKKTGHAYVIQKHAASHLHYDFRLQIGSVLKSWAVPKGPSLDPSVKRLAMHVEDHPLEYGSFEGTIPQGEYGGGTVMVWDKGTWAPEGDAEAGYRAGKLHFTLHGQKLRGEWVLVRRGNQAPGNQRGKEAWIFFKVRDDEARPGGPDILEEEPLSAKTGRDMDEIAAGSAVWHSHKKSAARNSSSTKTRKAADKHSASRASVKKLLSAASGASEARMPGKFEPQLATLVKDAPAGDEWFNEIKFDGYRMICHIDHKEIKFFSRNQLDWTKRLDHLVKAARGLALGQAIFDGEVVALESDGRSSFQALQNAFRDGRGQELIYYVFDLVYLDGKSLFKTPLEERKQILAGLIGEGRGPLRYSDHVEGHGPDFFRQASKMKLEGIVCKRRDQPYRHGRGMDWLKVKCSHREEFVIGGFTPPSGARRGFGALLVGYHDGQKKLSYAGRVGTGYSDKLLEDLSKRLKTMEQDASPFSDLSGRTGEARGVHWVKPQLVAEVEFSEWTRDSRLRHPAFLGLREDKPAKDVVREKPLALKTVKENANKASKMKKTSATATRSRAKAKGKQARSKRTAKHGQHASQVDLPGSVRLTHPDKVLYPEEGITKAQLASYYAQIGDWILPQLVDRPLVLVRCPEGQGKECFYQKHVRPGMPSNLRRVPIVEKNQKMEYVAVDDLEGLLSLVQIGVLEIHVWGSRTDNVELPDRLIFDLDPDPTVPWKRVVESALQLRQFFEELGLATFLKTTGGKGLHLVAPIARRLPWDEVKTICHAMAQAIVEGDPERYTANMSKAARPNKIYIDYLRNARGATAVAAYSTRARPGAPVSTPIAWDELPKLHAANQFTLADIPDRLAKLKRDPWEKISSTRQSISKSLLKKLHF